MSLLAAIACFVSGSHPDPRWGGVVRLPKGEQERPQIIIKETLFFPSNFSTSNFVVVVMLVIAHTNCCGWIPPNTTQ